MLRGQVGIVTGGAQGIGKGCAEALLDNGANVCLLDVNEGVLKKTTRELANKFSKDRVISCHCDVRNQTQMEGAFKMADETFKRIDIVINNAGVADEVMWQRNIDINYGGVLRGTLLALEYMNKGKGGIVINISSAAGLVAVPHAPVYCASKHAIVGLTRSIGEHPLYRQKGIRCIALCPMSVDTDMFRSEAKDTQEFLESFGLLKVQDLADALIEVIGDQDNSGRIMVIVKGRRYYVDLPNLKQIVGFDVHSKM
ncbi:15-hydroxyprostaglandin dehydrogenase [NAD(+)]-like [Ostrea edulis]|uniref:15-hydroxyprostaglandin dehydrogenase [NAD(+)]-like n=1 Tax=Ostrea edulis TaxID=37623 RepID=UPI00209442EC|nr:15-hydroxyprostaglandin dehydrogenase [NAD(+)]-like [Ostrea edulis]XP_056023081.1 15-hydroxyprostaglandin dehydrogenase [NAD(+)]-like [Ostrea edulis]XP_056023082.1 15-hydroxyprostaglandin dehydrogenase [NAD(+)]-like [Ostrea edulis]